MDNFARERVQSVLGYFDFCRPDDIMCPNTAAIGYVSGRHARDRDAVETQNSELCDRLDVLHRYLHYIQHGDL